MRLPQLHRANRNTRQLAVTADNLWTALALVLVIEGLLPFLSPQGWRRAVSQIAQLQDGQIRFFALLAMLIGLALLWF